MIMQRILLVLSAFLLASCTADRRATEEAEKTTAILQQLQTRVESFNNIGPGQSPVRKERHLKDQALVDELELRSQAQQTGWQDKPAMLLYSTAPRRKPDEVIADAVRMIERKDPVTVKYEDVSTDQIGKTIAALQKVAKGPDFEERLAELKPLVDQITKLLKEKSTAAQAH
jgi:hypothetical protein